MPRAEGGEFLRVALISEHASPLASIGDVDAGGQNVHVAELAAGLTRQGHDVVVYTRRDRADVATVMRAPAGYRVVHLDAGPAQRLPKDELWPHMPDFAEALMRCFDEERPDVAHAHFWMSGWATARAARSSGLPWLITFHALGAVKRRYQGAADPSPEARLAVEQSLVRHADGVIATCRDEVAELTVLGGERIRPGQGRLDIIPCGVDLNVFTPVRDATDALFPRRPDGPFRLVSVGRLVRRKGLDTVLDALVRLPHTELLVAGGPEAGHLGDDLEATRLLRLADRLGVADRVRFLGAVPRGHLPALLRSADAVVCVPWYEPFGIVPLEAMACGRPVIASAVGGLLDTVDNGGTGLHVPPRDPDALVRAVTALGDAEHRRALGLAAVGRARSHYSWDRVAARTVTVYRHRLARFGWPAPLDGVPIGARPAPARVSGR